MSRRTETAYKAESPGKSAQHDKAPMILIKASSSKNDKIDSKKIAALPGRLLHAQKRGTV
ncbi:MAG TPA: hypothetical protein DCZ97_16750 [Syntrophus sp. (in: bacteria)]|nr:MAG: hypothetical protein A2X92_03770 [Syntrophus sp. GWC2_56_31]HBB18558.1 hypothetical protein [Syntrophus sp. (in: bacteria)]